MRCKKCGTMLKDGAKFCPSCGSPAEAEETTSTAVCPSCGKEIKAGIKFCPFCGSSTEAPAQSGIKCPSCGTELKPGAKFCPGCGYNMSNPAPAEQSAPPFDSSAPAEENKTETAAPVVPLEKENESGIKCPSCGMELKPGAKFCPGCGYNMNNPAPAEQSSPSLDTPAPKPEESANKCTSCGAELKPGAKFCPVCGFNMAGGGTQIDTPAPVPQNQNVPAGQPQTQVKTKKTNILPFILIGAAAIVVIVVVIIILAVVLNKAPTVDLNEYITVKYEGYDGYGEAKVEFDTAKFNSDWKDKLSFKVRPSEIEYKYGFDYENPSSYIAACASENISLDKYSELKNGDTIHAKWEFSKYTLEKMSSYIKCEVKYSDKEFKVEDLKSIPTVDLFKDIQVEFEGEAPFGRASVYNNGDYYFDYELDKKENLSNGEKVTLSVSYSSGDINEYLASRYHVAAKEFKKEYTVSGLNTAVLDAKDIPEDALAKFKDETEDFIKSDTSADTIKLKGTEYLGSIMLVNKNLSGWYTSDRDTYVIYKVTVTAASEKNGKKTSKDYDYYTFERFGPVVLLEDGTASYSSDGSQCYNYLELGGDYHNDVHGYDDYSKMYDSIVTKNLAEYSFTSTVDEAKVKAAVKPAENSEPEESSKPEENSKPGESSKPGENSKPEESSNNAQTSKPQTSIPDGTLSLKEYINSNKSELEQLYTSDDTGELTFGVDGDDTLVITYKFKNKMPVTDATKTQIQSALDAQQSSVDTMIDTLESVTTTKDIKIKVKYLNSDGSVLGEKEFKKS